MEQTNHSVVIRGENIEVRELRWKDYLHGVKEITGTLMKLVSGNGKEVSLSAVNKSGATSVWKSECARHEKNTMNAGT